MSSDEAWELSDEDRHVAWKAALRGLSPEARAFLDGEAVSRAIYAVRDLLRTRVGLRIEACEAQVEHWKQRHDDVAWESGERADRIAELERELARLP